MKKRNLKAKGFKDENLEILQKAFDDEFKRDYEEAKARRKELKRRTAQQAGLMRRRLLMEQMLQEEQDALASNHQVSMILDLVKENASHHSLRLDLNSVSARALAKAMWSNSTITCLDLSSNGLNDHSGMYIARILNHNNTLKKLELDNNLFGTKTCQALSESLTLNDSLSFLSLDSNPLCTNDSSGFKSLIESIRYNKNITSLNLWRTGINSYLGKDLANIVEDNDALLFCDVGHNGIDIIDVQRIATRIDENLSVYEMSERLRRVQLQKDLEALKRQQSIQEVSIDTITIFCFTAYEYI